MVIDKMGIERADENDVPDYKSLYLKERGKVYGNSARSINEYGASNDEDAALLPLLSDGSRGSAAPGSSCFFHSGKCYVLGNSVWDLIGG